MDQEIHKPENKEEEHFCTINNELSTFQRRKKIRISVKKLYEQ